MSIIQLTLPHYFALLIFACICFILGRRALRGIEFQSVWETIGFSTAIGLGGVAYLVLLIGLFKVLYAWVLALSMAALLLIAILTTPSFFANAKNGFLSWRGVFVQLWAHKDTLIILVCLAAIIGSSILLPLYPPTEWDAIEYHLTTASIYARSHAILVTEYLRYPVFTQLNNMLFTLMLLVADDLSAQLIQYLFYLLVGVLIYAYSLRHFSKRIGLMAAVLWFSNLLAIWGSHVATIDIGLVFFSTAGIFAFLNYHKTRQMHWLVIAAVLLGFAAAVKYTALFWIAVCGIYTLWIGFQERRWRIPVIFALIAALAACPFYIRNVFYTGNPFFPYIEFLFKENIWTYGDFQQLSFEQGSYGLPVTLMGFVQLPWFLKVTPRMFNNGFPPYNWLYLAFLPATLIVGVLKPYLRTILIFSLSFTLFWFLTPQVLRYLFPTFPLFCLLTGAAFDYLLHVGFGLFENKSGWRLPGWMPSAAYLMIILVTTANVVLVNAKNVIALGLPPTTAEERSVFLQAHLPSFSAYQMLNKMENVKNYRLYALFDENMSYYADGVFMGDWFGPGRFSTMMQALSDSRKLYTELTKLDAQYFLYEGNRAKLIDQNLRLPNDPFFQEKFRKIYDEYGVQVFEIVQP